MKTRKNSDGQPSRDDSDELIGELAADQLVYIRQMALELRTMAARAQAPTLAYLLEMAALEAARSIRILEFSCGLVGDR